MPPKALSVIVLAFNNRALTSRCLSMLSSGWPDDWELLLVDNGSSEPLGDAGRLGGGDLRSFRTVRMARNETFAVANNAAVPATAGEKLIFLNNDVETTSEQLRVLASAIGHAKGPGVAGTKLLYPGGTTVQHAGVRPMLWGIVSNYGVGARADDPRVNRAGEVFAVTGACLCIDRRLFESLSGFDEGFRWGYEDIDLCLRASKAGRGVVYVPVAASVHAESATLGAGHYDATRDQNYRRYRSRWRGRLEPLEARCLDNLRAGGARRLVVFGDGAAGQALARVLVGAGFEVLAFAATSPRQDECQGLPLVALEELSRWRFDRLVVGTQAFFEVEAALASADPRHDPLFPVVD